YEVVTHGSNPLKPSCGAFIMAENIFTTQEVPSMIRSRNVLPTQKVAAGALAGALSIILVWVARQFAHVEIPAEVASPFTTVLTFGVSYLTPPAAGEVIEAEPIRQT